MQAEYNKPLFIVVQKPTCTPLADVDGHKVLLEILEPHPEDAVRVALHQAGKPD